MCLKNSLLALLLFILAGCSSNSTGRDGVEGKTADEIYRKGTVLMKRGAFSDAADVFNKVESLFPYSSIAAQGQIMAAYCHFRAENYLDASRELDIFIRYHSSHKLMPYALYLKAMCIYMKVPSVGRDARVAQDAKEAFVELVNRYPSSAYYADSVKKIAVLDGLLATREMTIGRYYQKRSSFFAAIARYNFVVSNFGHTNQVPEAYYRIIECCLKEGMIQEAEGVYAILKKSFFKSKWRKKADNMMRKVRLYNNHAVLRKEHKYLTKGDRKL